MSAEGFDPKPHVAWHIAGIARAHLKGRGWHFDGKATCKKKPQPTPPQSECERKWEDGYCRCGVKKPRGRKGE